MGLKADGWTVALVRRHQTVLRCLEEWHYTKGGPNTSTVRTGLFSPSGELAGVTLWLPPTKVAAQSVDPVWRGVLCLSRLAVSPSAPRNSASFLLGRSLRLIDRARWPTLLTYADTAHGHTGGIYKATNWECLGETKAGDTWVDPTGRQCGRKRGKKVYTAQQMRDMGCVKLPPMPKIKFVLR